MFRLIASWAALRTLLGPSWASLGEALAFSWSPLGSLGAPLGPLEPSKLRPKTVPKPAGVKKDRQKIDFGRTWPCIGASWPHLGASRAHLEGSWAVFWSLHGLPREIPTHVPGKVVTPGFQEHGWESLVAFRLDWLGISHASSWQQSPGTSQK